jgi:hypothetical protein
LVHLGLRFIPLKYGALLLSFTKRTPRSAADKSPSCAIVLIELLKGEDETRCVVSRHILIIKVSAPHMYATSEKQYAATAAKQRNQNAPDAHQLHRGERRREFIYSHYCV